MSPGQFLRKPCLIALRRLGVVGLKSLTWIYCVSSELVVWAKNVCATISDCYVSRGTSHISVCLFLVPFIICFPFFGTAISCLSTLVVFSTSHKTPTDISGSVFVFGLCESA